MPTPCTNALGGAGGREQGGRVEAGAGVSAPKGGSFKGDLILDFPEILRIRSFSKNSLNKSKDLFSSASFASYRAQPNSTHRLSVVKI